MRWIYREFFYVPKYAKVSEKVMNAHVALTVAVVVVSLVAMSLSAYAYFSCNISSGSSQLQAASFHCTFSITDSGGQNIATTEIAGNVQQALLPAGTHTIDIQATGTAATGFCIVELQNCDTVYHTQQLAPQSGFSFLVNLSEEAVISITPSWGTSSYFADYAETRENTEPYIFSGETISPVFSQPQQTLQGSSAPATEPPTTLPPATEAPTTEPAPTETPTTEPAPTEAPTTEPAPTEVPTTEPAPTEAPTTEPAVTESPN